MIINIKNGGKEGGYAAGKDKKETGELSAGCGFFHGWSIFAFWELPDAEKV